MEIRSKAQFFAAWRRGLLGNPIRVWDHIDDVPILVDTLGFREVGKAGGGAAAIVPRYLGVATAISWDREGRQYIMDEACPNHLTTLCGEVGRTYLGLVGRLAIEPRCSMREAKLLNVTGSKILCLLDLYMDPSSKDDIWQLLDLYPDAVVEFSCFPHDVGLIPNRNTIVWEVRNY